MTRRFAKVSEKEIKTAFFYPSELVNKGPKYTFEQNCHPAKASFAFNVFRRL